MPRGAVPRSLANPLVTHDVFYIQSQYPRWLDDIVVGAVRAVSVDMDNQNPHPVSPASCMKLLTTQPTLTTNAIRSALRRPGRHVSVRQASTYMRVMTVVLPHIQRYLDKEASK